MIFLMHHCSGGAVSAVFAIVVAYSDKEMKHEK